jgi:hypothetical protein
MSSGMRSNDAYLHGGLADPAFQKRGPLRRAAGAADGRASAAAGWANRSCCLWRKARVINLIPAMMFKIQRSLQRIYGLRYSAERTLLFMGEMLSYSWLLIV